MKIFDCFLFNGESLILDIRLNTLSKYVEKFIIVESKYDHQGNKKKLNFKFSNYIKFKDKIIYKIIDEFPPNFSDWERENYQRNFIINGLNEASDDDYILISDVDEIPDLSKIRNYKKFKFTIFEQKMFYYKVNLLNNTYPIWNGTKMCKKKYLKSPQWLRDQKVKKNSFWKFYRIKWNFVKDGGWHFSFLMDPKKIKKKIKAFAHSEFNNAYFTNSKKIEDSVNKKLDLFDRKYEYKIIKLNKTFPKYILENKNKFKKWII